MKDKTSVRPKCKCREIGGRSNTHRSFIFTKLNRKHNHSRTFLPKKKKKINNTQSSKHRGKEKQDNILTPSKAVITN